ncbi:MAG: Xaa-Pro peptidase family protein [Thaumarchaeota archaeon]|nr:Xaa-Pro peptidase family protein [Nitrososphaerota archaeon]
MTVYAQRRKRLLSLARGKQVVAMTGANIFYLTSFWGSGAAIVLPDKTVVVTSPLEADRVAELGEEVEVVVAKRWKDDPQVLMRQLERGGAVVDDDRMNRRSPRFKVEPALFLEARRTKDEVEIERIETASRGLDRVFEALTRELRPGRTEWEVAAEVMKVATANELTPSGSDSALSPAIVASGENGALPHSELTGRKIRRGDFVVADIFFRYKGYNSDETRTFAVGSSTREMRAHYAAVLEAQESALDLVRVGTPCGDVHEAAVRVLKRHGVDRYLNHSVGHGVGIDIHELPSIARGSKGRLLANDVVTDEPGVYLPGRYGIRIEDTVKTGSKPMVLTRFTKELLTVG